MFEFEFSHCSRFVAILSSTDLSQEFVRYASLLLLWRSLRVAVSYWAYTQGGLNESEAPGKVVTVRPPKRLAQLRSVPHSFVSTLQKHWSKTSKLIRFGNLHFRDNWG